MSNEMPVYYCLECGYVGNGPGNCPECHAVLMADDVHLPNEKEEERYEDGLLEEEEEEEDEDPILDEEY